MDTNAYWVARGPGYVDESRLNDAFYWEQEQQFVNVVGALFPVGKTILDVGCGFGRITRKLGRTFGSAKFVGADLSEDQLANARLFCKDLDSAEFCRHDLLSDEPLPAADIAVCCEVLLHIPKDRIAGVVRKILSAAPVLVHDFDPNWREEDPVADHCFFHDYPWLYDAMGLPHDSWTVGRHGMFVVRRPSAY